MYVAITGAGNAKVVQFVEQHRIPKTNRKKTIVIETIGNYQKLLAEDPEIIDKLKIEAKRRTAEKKTATRPVSVEMETKPILSSTDAYPSFKIGHHIIRQLWRELELDRFFSKHLPRKNQKDTQEAILQLVIHRLTHPKSILFTQQDIGNYAGMRQLHLKLYYNVLDHLNTLTDALIDHLCQQMAEKTDRKGPVAYYDVTTFSFESVNAGELRLFGFSKDNKSNEVQVVMGLLMDNQGIPISYQLFPGNTMDQSTLQRSVEDLKSRYNMKKIVVVADRGLNSKKNLAHLVQESHDFIISYTLKRAPGDIQSLALADDSWTEEKLDKAGNVIFKSKVLEYTLVEKVELTTVEQAALPKKKGRPRKYKEVEIETKIHVTWSKKRAEKDRKDRERVLEKVTETLKKSSAVEAQMKRGRNQYISVEVNAEEATLNTALVERQSCYDGYYAIITNQLSATTEEVTGHYGGLWQIEESFRILKSDLQTRPIYVWTDNHIKGHFAMCFLSFTLLRYLQYRLEKHGTRLSGQRITTALDSVRVTAVGSYPLLTLIPTGVTEDYLSISKTLISNPLMTTMTLSSFKHTTKLDLTLNYISGQT